MRELERERYRPRVSAHNACVCSGARTNAASTKTKARERTSTGHEMSAAHPPATDASVKRCAKSVLRYFASMSRNVSNKPSREVA